MSSKSYIFEVEHAQKYGVDEAIMIRHFIFWIEKNKAEGKNFREGRYWTYNTYEGFAEIFSFWSESQIRRILHKLVSLNVLIKENKFNKRANDKTNWYAFYNESEFITVNSPKEISLPESSDEPNLFESNNASTSSVIPSPPESSDNKENSLTKSSDHASTSSATLQKDEITLPESSVQKVEDKNLTDEIVSPADEIGTSICRNQQIDLTKSSEHYHIINNILNKITKTDINTGDFIDGGKFFFNFTDPEELDKQVTNMFKLYINAMPHFSFIDRVKKEMYDLRNELTSWTTWNIIVRCFTLYPGWEKQFRTIDSLIGKIRKTKDKYCTEHYKAFVKQDELNEARKDRINKINVNGGIKWNQDERKEIFIKEFNKYKTQLSLSESNNIEKMIESNNIFLAQTILIGILAKKGIAA